MRVLVPLPYDVSNLAHGRNLRVVHLLRHLAHRAEITLLAATEAFAEAARGVLPDVRVVRVDRTAAEAAPNHGSWLLRRSLGFIGADMRLQAAVLRSAAACDVVLGFDLLSLPYLLAVREATDAATICDVIDDPWLTWRSTPAAMRWSIAGLKTAVAVRTLRAVALPRLDGVIAVAAPDAASLACVGRLVVGTVPNGVVPDTSPAGPREPLAVMTGAMHFPPNAAAAEFLIRHVWPRVRTRLRSTDWAQLAIVGCDPSPWLKRLAKEAGVIVTGRVDDLRAWLRRARVSVAPMVSGCGMKNKILEALACGCPVVATSRGAAGLPCGRASGILTGDTPDALAAQVAGLLSDPARAEQIGHCGHQMVREKFAWEGSAERLRTFLQAAIHERRIRIAQRTGAYVPLWCREACHAAS